LQPAAASASLEEARAAEEKFAEAAAASRRAREEAVAARLPDFAKQVAGRLHHYERGEAAPAAEPPR
jgi:hypothetical protein